MNSEERHITGEYEIKKRSWTGRMVGVFHFNFLIIGNYASKFLVMRVYCLHMWKKGSSIQTCTCYQRLNFFGPQCNPTKCVWRTCHHQTYHFVEKHRHFLKINCSGIS